MASRQAGGASLGNGRYEIREHIATGGMATVYKAWDTRVERIVAIKVLRSLAKTDRNAVERFRREAHAAARLSHPNAVTIYDFLEERGEHFLIMEYVEGVNLKQLLAQKGTLSAEEAVDFTCQMCSVLQVAHAQGFIHRDIKPQNIMITPAGEAKLTDFGIVRVMEAAGLTNSGIVLGTADYLSPEQARGETLTPASDLYSLGVVLYEMMAGRPPFVGTSAVQVAMQHANKVPPPPSLYNPRIPRSLESVIKKALQKQPQWRYPDAEAMRVALQESLKKSLEEGATIPGSFPAVEPPAGRRTSGQVAAAAHPASAAPLGGPPSHWTLRPPPTSPDADTPQWAYLLIFLAALILVGALAVGAYFALRKPTERHSLYLASASRALIRREESENSIMQRDPIATPHAPAAIGPYSQAIKAGNLVFTAGQIPLDPTTGQMVSGGIQEQTQRVLENLGAVLAAAGSSFEAVVKTNVFLKSMNDFAAMNEVYGRYFTGAAPARSTVAVADLPRGSLVEIECVALVVPPSVASG